MVDLALEFRCVSATHRDAISLAGEATTEGDQLYADVGLPPAPSLSELLTGRLGRVLVGYRLEEPIACGVVRSVEAQVGEIKRMFVVKEWRERGVGRLLLAALEDEARDLGLERVRLDTGDRQVAALRLYRSSGYLPIDDYNGQPGATHWFEKNIKP